MHCLHCGGTFTFARPQEIQETPLELARLDLGESASLEELASWVLRMELLWEPIRPGKEYVYLDGSILPTHATRVQLEGLMANHDLTSIPQVEALRNPETLEQTLKSPRYWMEVRDFYSAPVPQDSSP